MKKKLLPIIISIFFSLFSLPTIAEKSHGIAMHGKPKYDSDFSHLEYVNPNAPKGGIIKFGSRIDIYVPEDYITDIKAGDEVIAGETILFTKKNKENVLE